MTTVYIVEGNCGSYDDYRNWVVAVFTEEEKAEKWAEGCRNWAANTLKWLKKRKKCWYDVTTLAVDKRFGLVDLRPSYVTDEMDRMRDEAVADIIRSFNPFDDQMSFDGYEAVEYQVYQGGELNPTCNHPVVPSEPKEKP
jgi:hypothetical protein